MADVDLPKSMILLYVNRRVQDIETLEKGLKSNDVSDFQRIGHQLKGNARSYGFPELESIALSMEKVTLPTLKDTGAQVFNKFSEWVQTTRKKLSES